MPPLRLWEVDGAGGVGGVSRGQTEGESQGQRRGGIFLPQRRWVRRGGCESLPAEMESVLERFVVGEGVR